MNTAYIYLPWVRQGLAGAIQPQDLSTVTLKNRVQMPIQVWVNNEAPVTANVKLYGPGDVIGFDFRQVIRTEPKPFTNNFEPNYFPFIEFDRPDFPWMFTPAQANSQGQLRPWLCLIVVEKKEEILKTSQPLPVLTIDNNQLPDLTESWAWVYAQVMDTGDLASALRKYPEQNLSRMVCPYALKENTNYYACLVPSFEAGRLAGLGLAVNDNDDLSLAWNTQAPGSTQLPVYYHWEFGTGPAGDFEALVWQLERRDLSELADKIGTKPMLVQNVGVLGLEGALRVVEIDESQEQQVRQALQHFSQDLQDLLNSPDSSQIQPSWLGNFTIKPPQYGRWQAACKSLINDPVKCPVWHYELNLDPRHRVAAGVGTQIVQKLQESLMAAAWQQVEGIEKANQLLRQGQLARAGSKTFHQQLCQLPTATMISVTGPVHSRVLSTSQTIHRQMDASPIPLAAVTGAFRKVTSPRGILSRRAIAFTNQDLNPGRLLERLNNGQIKVVNSDFEPAGMTSNNLSNLYENINGPAPQDQSFITAARAQQANLHFPGEPHRPSPLNLAAIRQILVAALDPETTIPAVINERITPPDGWTPEDSLEPIMAAPVFPTPMYKPLLELSQDWLLPGLELVPNNTIAGLMTNPRFIRAYMVGLNHEMSRELLWREFPTDQRGTYFQQFWDPTGHIPKPQTAADWEKLKDIAPIPDWPKKAGLAASLANNPMKNQVVLLIRGELLRRYPGAVIYAAQAEWNSTPLSQDFWGRKIIPVVSDPQAPGYVAPGSQNFPEKYPAFQGKLDPDLTFICFDLDPEQARGFEDPNHQQGAGWFFVIQQPPTEPRYGLDATAPTVTATVWTDLSWENVSKSSAGYIQLSGGLNNFPALTAPSGAVWGRNLTSADLASICLQRPVRIAIHASDLLAPKVIA